MSFSKEIKTEITGQEKSKLEYISTLSAFLRHSAYIGNEEIKIFTENVRVARYIFKLIKEIYNISPIITIRRRYNFNESFLYILEVKSMVNLILEDVSIKHKGNNIEVPLEYIVSDEEIKRAYLTGCFLACGSINNPKTARYHLEFSVSNNSGASFLNDLLNSYELNSKIISKNRGYVVYVKEAEKISDFLKIMNVPGAVLYFEDIRIYRDHVNMTNRLNNCEQANMDKIIFSADEQIDDIKIIVERFNGLELLDEKIRVVCEYRLKYPESSLQELSEIISIETEKPITKSGLNHRFRKIKEIANKIRNKNI